MRKLRIFLTTWWALSLIVNAMIWACSGNHIDKWLAIISGFLFLRSAIKLYQLIN